MLDRSPASRSSSSASSSRSRSARRSSPRAGPTSSRWNRSREIPCASWRRWLRASRVTSSPGTGASTRCRSTCTIRPPRLSSSASLPGPTSCSPTSVPAWPPSWASTGRLSPRAIHASWSATSAPSAARGPSARLAGMDLVVQARSGLLAASGRVQDGVPTGGENPVADYMCALMLAFGVRPSLFRRANTGRGGEVDASLLMSSLVLQHNNMVRIEAADGVAHGAIRARLEGLRAAGRPYAEQAALTPQIRPPGTVNVYYRTYATRDAAIAVACGSPALRRAFIRAVGLADPALDRPIGDREKELQHYAALRRSVEAALASRTTAQWQATFEAAGIPAAGVKLPLELLDDEQPLANGMLHDLAHPALGRIRVLAPPVSMDGRGFVPAPATSPFGSETRAILGDLGFSSADVGALLAEGVTREGLPPRLSARRPRRRSVPGGAARR